MKIGTVYQIRNVVNNRIYIGSSIYYETRKRTHFRMLKKGNHHNYKMQNDWNNKHLFEFTILAEVDAADLRKVELEFIQTFKPHYNISKDTIAPMQDRKHSLETIEKFKKVVRKKGYKTKPWSQELRDKITKARTGLKRSQEFKDRRKLEAILDGRSSYLTKSIENKKKQIKDSLGNVFNSLTEAAQFHEISKPTVCDILKGRHSKTRKGVSFEYA